MKQKLGQWAIALLFIGISMYLGWTF